jgi:hypothetical protein
VAMAEPERWWRRARSRGGGRVVQRASLRLQSRVEIGPAELDEITDQIFRLFHHEIVYHLLKKTKMVAILISIFSQFCCTILFYEICLKIVKI